MNLDNFDPSKENHIIELEKIKKIIINSINKVNLDLKGFTVLTEAATGYWQFTPFIAAFANADTILCKLKNTKYGKPHEIKKNYENLISYFNLKQNFKFFESSNDDIISTADIVTNSGNVRPINAKFIKKMKKTGIISLMWEPWEFRDIDLDLTQCMKNGICVIGVNEENSILNVMKHDGELIQQIFSDNDISLKNKNILLIAENRSALYMIKSLKKQDVNLDIISSQIPNDVISFEGNLVSSSLENLENFVSDKDFIIINSHPITKPIIGKNGYISSKKFKMLSKAKIILFFGTIDYDDLVKNGVPFLPNKKISPGYMGWKSDLLDPIPTIELNTLGLKSGEIVAKYRKSGLTYAQSIKKAVQSPYCLDFSVEQKTKYFSKSIHSNS